LDAPAHQPLADAVQRLQIKLLGRLHRDKAHRRPRHGLSDRLGVAVVAFFWLFTLGFT
jgi:hypothetical protein